MNRLKNTILQLQIWDEAVSQQSAMRIKGAILASITSLCIVAFYAVGELNTSTYPFDLDSWGHLITSAVSQGQELSCSFSLLQAHNPNRGYLVPAIFGWSYCITQLPEAVQILNALLHAAAGGILVLGLAKPLKSLIIPAAGILIWSAWPAYSFIHGYYYAEQIGAFFTLSVTVLYVILVHEDKVRGVIALTAALFLGLLINVRPSSLLLVLVALIFLIIRLRQQRLLLAGCLLLFSATYATLPFMNYKIFDTFVPLTTQGGFALHEGTYLPGDDLPANALRKIPEFNVIEAKAAHLNPLEKDKYFKELAIQQIMEDPVGQMQLLVKKSLRFWANIPGHSWIPTTKSLIIGLPVFLLWLFNLWCNRNPVMHVLNIAVLTTWAMHAAIHSEYRYSYVVLPIILIAVFFMLKRFLVYLFLKPSKKISI
jgi:hypothetical protein